QRRSRWFERGGRQIQLGALAGLLAWSRRLTRFGTSDQGGMVVEVVGLDAGSRPTTARWSLIAGADDGPTVPIMAAAAALRCLLSGRVQAGADLAPAILSLDDIQAEMDGYAISAHVDYLVTAPAVIDAEALPQPRGDQKLLAELVPPEAA
ncbi:MAG: hypothetical protein AAF556_07150, partial [Pseudomonadota bacterium]